MPYLHLLRRLARRYHPDLCAVGATIVLWSLRAALAFGLYAAYAALNAGPSAWVGPAYLAASFVALAVATAAPEAIAVSRDFR